MKTHVLVSCCLLMLVLVLVWQISHVDQSLHKMHIPDHGEIVVSRPGGLKAHIKLVSSPILGVKLEGGCKWASMACLEAIARRIQQGQQQLGVRTDGHQRLLDKIRWRVKLSGKLWISPRHGVRTVTFWLGSYGSASKKELEQLPSVGKLWISP